MKQALPRLWGNDTLRARIGNDICAHRLSHAYILEGRYGMGKHTLAMQIAAAQSCLNKDSDAHPLPCGTCKNCRKILEGKSPAEIAVRTFDNGTATVNTETCELLGLDYEALSEAMAPFCTRIQPITTAESFEDVE